MKPEMLGPYRIGRKLGRGGMGTVYSGTNVQTGEAAAVKILAAALAEEEGFRQRFEAEIETLRKLNHPNIVRLFGFGEQDGQLFYAMELVEGTSLEEELRRGRSFGWRDVTRIGIDTCQALRHAHDRGVIHRDIKPANLLLAGDDQLKLSDFGIAKLFGNTRLTMAGNVLGTVEYMAPEQADGRPVDPRSDLYSLGGVLFALLARRPPFEAKSLPEMLQKQRSVVPQPVRRYAVDVPAELEAIIAQLLEKKPERRILTATVLSRRLQAMLHALSLPADDGKGGFEVGQPVGSPDEVADDDLPPTRVLVPEEKSPAAHEGPPPAAHEDPSPSAGELPDTTETSAFKRLDAEAGGDSTLPEGPESDEEPQPNGRFTVVEEEELDRFESAEPAHAALISPQTWVLAICLITVGLTAWYLLRPPSADTLYGRIAARINDGTTDSLLEAEDDIQQFLMRFPDDSKREQLRRYQKRIELHRLERKFELQAKWLGRSEHLLPIERTYLEAINYVRLDPERGAAKLQAMIDLYDQGSELSGPTGQYVELARGRLTRLRAKLDERVPAQLALLKRQLDQAEKISRTDPAKARAMWRAVIELYRDKPWAGEAVRRAREGMSNRRTRN